MNIPRSKQKAGVRTLTLFKIWGLGFLLAVLIAGVTSVDNGLPAGATSTESSEETSRSGDVEGLGGEREGLDDLTSLLSTPEERAEVATPVEAVDPAEPRRVAAIPELPEAQISFIPAGDTIDSERWTITATINRESVGNVIDNDFATRWSAAVPSLETPTVETGSAGAPYLQVDLGSRESFDRIALATASDESFGGIAEYAVFVSNNPDDFGEPIAVGSGRLLTLINFEPVTNRFIRIVETSSDPAVTWAVSELAIYSAEPPAVVAPATTSTTTTTTAAPTTTTIATTTIPAPTTTTTAAVRDAPPAPAPRSVAPATTQPAVTTTTRSPTTTTTAAPTPETFPIPNPSNWSFSASATRETPALSIDGDIETRWSTSQRQRPGQFFQVDFGSRATFSEITLALDEEAQPFDYPRGYEVYAFDNPNNVGSPIASGAGETFTTINFDSVTARFVRIVQTSRSDDRWWSIYELDIN